MKNIIVSILFIFNAFYSVDLFSQDKNTADIFDGFRDFKFFTTINDYYDYNYKKINTSDYYINYSDDNIDVYEIILPDNESQFLETDIKKIHIAQYKDKIFEVTLILEKDISDILDNMFVKRKDKSEKQPYLSGNWLTPPASKTIYNGVQEGSIFDKIATRVATYQGNLTTLEYGSIKVYEYYEAKQERSELGGKTYFRGTGPPSLVYYLAFTANGFSDKIDGKKDQIHYDTYLSDFGGKHYPAKNESKHTYSIPLFQFGNAYYVRALFGDELENLLFDTGATQLIISQNLYNRLEHKQLVIDGNSSSKMILANGNTVELKKVIIKKIQLNDLNVNNIEAYVNTSSDISLLGQSFLKRFGSISVDYKLNVLTIKK